MVAISVHGSRAQRGMGFAARRRIVEIRSGHQAGRGDDPLRVRLDEAQFTSTACPMSSPRTNSSIGRPPSSAPAAQRHDPRERQQNRCKLAFHGRFHSRFDTSRSSPCRLSCHCGKRCHTHKIVDATRHLQHAERSSDSGASTLRQTCSQTIAVKAITPATGPPGPWGHIVATGGIGLFVQDDAEVKGESWVASILPRSWISPAVEDVVAEDVCLFGFAQVQLPDLVQFLRANVPMSGLGGAVGSPEQAMRRAAGQPPPPSPEEPRRSHPAAVVMLSARSMNWSMRRPSVERYRPMWAMMIVVSERFEHPLGVGIPAAQVDEAGSASLPAPFQHGVDPQSASVRSPTWILMPRKPRAATALLDFPQHPAFVIRRRRGRTGSAGRDTLTAASAISIERFVVVDGEDQTSGTRRVHRANGSPRVSVRAASPCFDA